MTRVTSVRGNSGLISSISLSCSYGTSASASSTFMCPGIRPAIHPVAGRLPGHMNVLLAEADAPSEQLRELADINGEVPRTAVSLVRGAKALLSPPATL